MQQVDGKRPTLSVVARAAGVSVPTVSKVINGREDVSSETRIRVERVIEELGYVHRARFDAGKRSQLVDVVVHGLDNSWSAAVLHGAEDAAHEAGLDVVVSAALIRARGGRPERGWLDKLYGRGSDGMLFNLAGLSATQHTWLAQHRIPYVMIDPSTEPPAHVPSVAATNWAGGVSATEHLLSLGHHRIAVIGGYRGKLCSRQRVAGYRAALAAAGERGRPEYIRYGNFHAQRAELRMHELLNLPEPPTAVFVCSDRMALGAYRALRLRGLSVPGDISLVGFDDLPEAEWMDPSLTTVQQPLSEMAGTAVRTLVKMMNGEELEEVRIELATRLVVRASTDSP